tara:strand:- start:180 stop:1829 length:1650 start_codon:yes stop_codon:yes gene_type:complete
VIVSYIIIPLSILFFYLSLKGLGSIFFKIAKLENSQPDTIYPIISFPLIFFVTTVLHFFTKLHPNINLSIFMIGFLIYILKLKKKENLFFLFVILIIVSIQFIGHEVNEDFGYYHLPYIINFVSDKLILGLSHLSMVQGYNSAWLNTTSLFYLPIVLDKTVHFANVVIFFSLFIYYLNFLSKKNNFNNFPLSSLYAILSISFFIIKNSRLNSYGVDVPGHIYASLVFFLFLNFYEKKDFDFRKKIFYLISIFSIFCILIKLSYIPLIIFPLICVIFEKKILSKKIIIIIFLLGVPWILQQVAYTSCIIFPLDFTCIKFLPWYSKSFINDAAFSLEYINKSYWVYEGPLSQEEYVKNFSWVKTWFLRNIIELSENLLTFIIPLILLVLFNFKGIKKTKQNIKKKTIIIFALPIMVGFAIWFLKAPVVRYGIFYLNTIIFLIFLFIFREKIFFYLNKKFFLTILIISLTFNISKNLNRISNVKQYEEFPFPEIKKIYYSTKIINNLNFHTPIIRNDPQSGVCWHTPIYCRAGDYDHLNISINKGYLVITDK